MPLINQKKNCYTVVGDGENLHVLEFFAVGNESVAVLFFILSRVAYVANPTEFISAYANKNHTQGPTYSKEDIRNPLSLLAHERSRFATCVQFIYGQFVNLRMQHNRYYGISLYACVTRGAVV